MSRLVRASTLRGFRDLLPADMLLRNEIVDRVRRVYESYGYLPMDTPVLESLEALTGSGGDEADKLMFTAQVPGEEPVGMRFDLTVPWARFVAQYNPQQIRLPFRRYQLGPVFRADDPQPEQGRFRQFTQLDIDIAGTASIAADAEILAVMAASLESLNLAPAPLDGSQPGYFIRFNNRLLVDAFLDGIGIGDPGTVRHVLRVLDKADKITADQVRAELGEGRYDVSGDRIPGVGLSGDRIDAILDFASVRADTRSLVADALASRVADGPLAQAAFSQVRELLAHLDVLGVSENSARLDPSLARGLAYYTGTVYEGSLAQAGVGSVLGGGRYDGLVSRFSDEPVPAVGASIGLDRLIAGVQNLGLELGTAQLTAPVLVLVMPGTEPTVASAAAHELRSAGVPTELYVGEAAGKVGKQLAYANARGFAAAVMIGAHEVRDDTVTIKDLGAGNQARASIEDNKEFRAAASAGQQTVSRAELVPTVRSIVSGFSSGGAA
jgi:histidyl-tRNA synthetase